MTIPKILRKISRIFKIRTIFKLKNLRKERSKIIEKIVFVRKKNKKILSEIKELTRRRIFLSERNHLIDANYQIKLKKSEVEINDIKVEYLKKEIHKLNLEIKKHETILKGGLLFYKPAKVYCCIASIKLK